MQKPGSYDKSKHKDVIELLIVVLGIQSQVSYLLLLLLWPKALLWVSVMRKTSNGEFLP